MLDAVPREDDALAGVEPHRATDDEGALGEAQPLGHIGMNTGVRHRLVVLGDRGAIERRIPFERSVNVGFVDARHRGAQSTAHLPENRPRMPLDSTHTCRGGETGHTRPT